MIYYFGKLFSAYDTEPDYFGNAIIPNAPPFVKNSIHLDQSTIPADIDNVGNHLTHIPWRGSVHNFEFSAQKVQRIIVSLKQMDNSYIMAMTLDQNQQEVGVLQNNGQAYLSIPDLKRLYLRKYNGETCDLDLSNIDKESPDILVFETKCLD